MQKTEPLPCNHCEGQGYAVIRDCVGEIQYESTCPMCGGTGTQISTQIVTQPETPQPSPIAPE